MNYSLKILNSGIRISCWLVKGTCASILLLVLAIFIGEGSPNPLKFTARELFLMTTLLTTWVGLALALWQQLLGGIVILVSIAGLTIIAGVQENWIFYAFWLIEYNLLVVERITRNQEMNIQKIQRYCLNIVRWTARILGGLLVILVLIIAIGEAFFYLGEGLPNPFTQPLPTALMFLWFFITLSGLVVGWKWEGLGGILTIGGIVAFYITNFIKSGHFPRGYAFPMFYIPGILFLLCWFIKKLHRKEFVLQKTVL